MWRRRNVRVAASQQKPRRVFLSRGSSSCPLSSSSSSSFTLLPTRPRLSSPAVEHLTHDDGPLCNIPGRVQSFLVSLAVPRKRTTSATTICHFTLSTSLQPRVYSSRGGKNGRLNQRDNLHAARYTPRGKKGLVTRFDTTWRLALPANWGSAK